MIKKLCLGLLMFAICTWSPLAGAASDALPVNQWVGHEFIFLPLPTDQQSIGYEIYPASIINSVLRDGTVPRLPYAAHLGKKVTVTSVDSPQNPWTGYYTVYMTEQNTGMRLAAISFRSQVEGLVLASDFYQARQKFIGTTIYAKRPVLPSYPNLEPVSVSFGQPMKVLDIMYGVQASQPLLMLAEFNNTKVLIPTAYSWTNQPPNLGQNMPPWHKDFFLEDPHRIPGITPDVWPVIAESQIQKGMLPQQVRLSWGAPLKITSFTEKGIPTELWNYETYELCFMNNVLVSIKELDNN